MPSDVASFHAARDTENSEIARQRSQSCKSTDEATSRKSKVWNGQSTPILRMSRMRPCNLKIFRILGKRYRNRRKAVNEQVTDLIVIECS